MRLLLLVLFSLSVWSQAEKKICKCPVISESDYFNDAVFIFDGTVSLKTYKRPSRIFQVKVEQKYKGEYAGEDILIYSNTDECGLQLQLGFKYVIFVNKIIDEQKVYFNACHKYYVLDEKSINSEKHINLITMMKNEKLEDTYKTPSYDKEHKKKAKSTGRFSKTVEDIHSNEDK